MFDYTGFSERKIARLCSPFFATRPLNKAPYWTTEVYSFGRYLKEYAEVPQWMTLFVYAQHYASNQVAITKHEIESDAEAMLVFHPGMLEEYKKKSDKPCYLITMPYALHRRRHNITRAPDARGTLVFPFHSTGETDVVFDIDKYAARLRELPPEFHPLCVSMHEADIRKGLHREFIKRGFPVYTAGHTHDVHFGDRIYSIMRHFKYTASNIVGSSAYYSVEMGIPFSLFGDAAALVNVSDPNIPQGHFDRSETPGYREEIEAFSGIHAEITPRQEELVNHALGIGRGLSSAELREILLDAYRKRRGNAFKEALNIHKRRMKYGAARFMAGCLDRVLP